MGPDGKMHSGPMTTEEITISSGKGATGKAKAVVLSTDEMKSVLAKNLKGREIFEKDPSAWVEKIFLPAVAKKMGASDFWKLSEQQRKRGLVQAMPGAKNTAVEMMAQFALNHESFQKNRSNYKMAADMDQLEKKSISTENELKKLSATWSSFNQVLFSSKVLMEPLVRAIKMLNDAIANMTKGVNAVDTLYGEGKDDRSPEGNANRSNAMSWLRDSINHTLGGQAATGIARIGQSIFGKPPPPHFVAPPGTGEPLVGGVPFNPSAPPPAVPGKQSGFPTGPVHAPGLMGALNKITSPHAGGASAGGSGSGGGGGFFGGYHPQSMPDFPPMVTNQRGKPMAAAIYAGLLGQSAAGSRTSDMNKIQVTCHFAAMSGMDYEKTAKAITKAIEPHLHKRNATHARQSSMATSMGDGNIVPSIFSNEMK
jgi:hypothetical protein